MNNGNVCLVLPRAGTLADVTRFRIRRVDVDDETLALLWIVDDFFESQRVAAQGFFVVVRINFASFAKEGCS